jgi:hypothetical protein
MKYVLLFRAEKYKVEVFENKILRRLFTFEKAEVSEQ